MAQTPGAVAPARVTLRVAALTCVGAITFASVGLGAASAAPEPWEPAAAGLVELPAQSVDGEITVTEVADGKDSGVMRSFTRVGAPVTYGTTLYGRDVTWGPAGDIVTRSTASGTVYGGQGESLLVKQLDRTGPFQFSPFGDSVTRTLTSSAWTGSRLGAEWQGPTALIESLSADLSAAPGAGAPLANGSGVVVELGTTPSRDLGLLDATFPRLRSASVATSLPAPSPLGYGALDARDPAVSSDGTLAFVGGSGATTALFVDEGSGPTKLADLGASCPGLRPSFAPSAAAIAYLKPVAGSCSSTELRLVTAAGGTLVGGADELVAASPSGTRFESPSWRARTPKATSLRLSGTDRMATGVAISEWGWADRSAPAVVLTGADAFPDSVVASPLAAQSGSPLLLTPTAALDSRVLTEIQRVLDPANGVVYIVGGTGAVSAGVESALTARGFQTWRLAGADRYSTGVAVAEELDWLWGDSGAARSTVFLADGTTFPDALVAGPAATTYHAPVLLTNGSTVPQATKAYIAQHSPSTIWGIGGAAALAAYTDYRASGVVGRDRYETARMVAERFFAGANVLGFASGELFPDALTGGVLMGNLWQPLLLVGSTTDPTVTTGIGWAHATSLDHTLVFGGLSAVPDHVTTSSVKLAGTQTPALGWDVPRVPNPRMSAGDAPAGDGAVERLRKVDVLEPVRSR